MKAAELDRLPGLRCDQEGPVFGEPWEAEVFAIAVHLCESGQFSWDEWAAALNREIDRAQAAGDPDLGDTYYLHWLNALLENCAEKGLVLPDGLRQRTEEWRAAYLRTPHGRPVQLSPALWREAASF